MNTENLFQRLIKLKIKFSPHFRKCNLMNMLPSIKLLISSTNEPEENFDRTSATNFHSKQIATNPLINNILQFCYAKNTHLSHTLSYDAM